MRPTSHGRTGYQWINADLAFLIPPTPDFVVSTL
jgi:hypothetical protein